jgi:hypothetical protein
MTQQDNHAEQQARAQLSSIREMLAADSLDWDRLEELRDLFADCPDNFGEDEAEELAELEEAAGDFASQEAALQAMLENQLDISFRSGWGSAEDLQPEEFQILLCTGGPAVRIMGELDFSGQPHRAWFEYQDWGTPWTMLFEGQSDALDYAQRVICL